MIGGQLQIGFNDGLHIRNVYLSTCRNACRLMYISDIHLRHRRSEKLSQQILEVAGTVNADALILGGDLVDSSSMLQSLSELVVRLSRRAPVFAVGGNHDNKVGMDQVHEAVTGGGGHWIHDGVASITHESRVITLYGPVSKASLEGDVRVLCAHNPRIWKTSRNSGYDLVLAGHLHGCQIVAFEYWDRLFPGAIFYPYCFLDHQYGSTRLVVSRGISDLIPVRWRCPREVVVCHV